MGAHQAVLYMLGLLGSLMAQPWLTWKELPQLMCGQIQLPDLPVPRCGCRLDTGHGSSAHRQEVSTKGTSGPRALLLPS